MHQPEPYCVALVCYGRITKAQLGESSSRWSSKVQQGPSQFYLQTLTKVTSRHYPNINQHSNHPNCTTGTTEALVHTESSVILCHNSRSTHLGLHRWVSGLTSSLIEPTVSPQCLQWILSLFASQPRSLVSPQLSKPPFQILL